VKKFVFGVITYNHEKYIIEHLESIKFLILSFGKEMNFKLVLADDGSKDRSVAFVRSWVEQNASVFQEVVIIADGVNRGTCVNYTNIWKHIDSPLFKITAGDDVYSYVNILEIAEGLDRFDYISGMPLLLIDGQILESRSTVFHILATKYIFLKRAFRERLNEISVMNTPNLLYTVKFVRNEGVFSFIRKFKVTEDYPMMVKIVEEFKNVTFHQLNEVLIYYRRTSGSTYLIKEVDFNSDKVILFKYLIEKEEKWVSRLLLKNRLWCYQSSKTILGRLFNLNYYAYGVRVLLNLPHIWGEFSRIDVQMDNHRKHYKEIARRADEFIGSIEQFKMTVEDRF
jgi:glycosyltransferase involved in cell wall biosynthesis